MEIVRWIVDIFLSKDVDLIDIRTDPIPSLEKILREKLIVLIRDFRCEQIRAFDRRYLNLTGARLLRKQDSQVLVHIVGALYIERHC